MLFFRKNPEKTVDPEEGGGSKPKTNEEFRAMFLKKE